MDPFELSLKARVDRTPLCFDLAATTLNFVRDLDIEVLQIDKLLGEFGFQSLDGLKVLGIDANFYVVAHADLIQQLLGSRTT